MALQKIFTLQYISQLKNNINVNSYMTGEFSFDEEQIKFLKGVEHDETLCDRMMAAPTLCDAAIILYENFKTLSPAFASTEMLWMYLAHNDLFPFVKKYWPDIVAKYGDDRTEASSINYIKQHWFYYQGKARTSLMGLWWSVYLTVQKGDDPYELTRIFFLNDGLRTRRLGTGHLGRNREALIGILTFIKDHKDLFDTGIENRMIWITRHFNLIGASIPLIYKDRDYFRKELEKNLNLLTNIKTRADAIGPQAVI